MTNFTPSTLNSLPMQPAANTEFAPLTKAQAMTRPTTMYHRKLRNSDGTAMRARSNGKCKTWVTRPEEFRLPAKHGLYDTFYIDHDTAKDWSLQDPTAKPEQA
jgi:hypothetical protein